MATAYWVIYVDANTIALATSLALAKAGTKTALTAGSCADMYLQRNSFGAIGTGLIIPDNAIVTNAWVDVETTPKSWAEDWGTGAEDGSTLALSILSANDLVSAIAISSGTIWDAGLHGTLVGWGTGADATQDTAIELTALVAASQLKLTADSELTATIAVETMSQGKMDIYVDYLI